MKTKKYYLERLKSLGNLPADLRALRKKAGLSQTELARRAGTTQRIISGIETDRYQHPSLDIVRRIVKAL